MNSQNQAGQGDTTGFLSSLRSHIWLVCIPAWLFGAVERGVAVCADRALSSSELMQLLTAAFFLLSWLLLKPAPMLTVEPMEE